MSFIFHFIHLIFISLEMKKTRHNENLVKHNFLWVMKTECRSVQQVRSALAHPSIIWGLGSGKMSEPHFVTSCFSRNDEVSL